MTSFVYKPPRPTLPGEERGALRAAAEFLVADIHQSAVEQTPDGWLVRTRAGPVMARLVDHGDYSALGLEVWWVARLQVSDPSRSQSGEVIALFADGAAYRLRDQDGLRSAYARIRHRITPLDLAELVIAVLEGRPDDRVIKRTSDLERFGLPESRFGAVTGLCGPSFAPKSEGSVFSVCSYRIEAGRAHVTRWEVEDRAGALSWRCVPVAEDVELRMPLSDDDELFP